MLVNTNELIHVMERPRFAGDFARQFVGTVISGTDSVIRATGSVFVQDRKSGEFLRKPESRQRIVSLVDAGLIVKIMPPGTSLEKLRIEYTEEGVLQMTDGKYYTMDISEFDTDSQ